MDAHTLEALEFGKVVEKLKEFASSDSGREIVGATAPMTDLGEVRRRLAVVTEIRRVMEACGRFPSPAFRDVREHVARAGIVGSTLPPQAMLDIAALCVAARELRDFLLKHCNEQPNLRKTSESLHVLIGLERRISATLDESGNVLDDASEDLAEIRAEIRQTEFRIRERLKAVIEAPESAEWLQEKYFTMRDGRHVLPVNANLKTRIEGIVHDRSDTGQTVFIEPVETVGLGNELRDLGSLERVEVNRILLDLTSAVREALPMIAADHEILARMDADRAKAAFSLKFAMSEPQLEKEGDFVLLKARHPVLLFSGADAVPVDLSLTRDTRCLVITGPNAGGKTVALKTLGLLALMAQAGLHVPAGERSRFRMFRKVYADIGDFQSIEEHMSSFTSHLTRISGMLSSIDERTLVLLDELGAATDPEEGGALSCAVLSAIHGKGAWTAATTHLSDLKVLAHSTPGMANAAVQFDPGTGMPTFQVRTGIPGSSRAIETAMRLGLPSAIIASARGNLAEGKARLEAAIADLEAESARISEERQALEAARKEAGMLKEKYRAHVAAAKKEKREILRKAAGEASEIVLAGRKMIEETVRKLRESAESEAGRSGAGLKAEAKDARSRLERKIEELKRAEVSLARDERPRNAGLRLEVGAEAQVKSLRSPGVITAIDLKRGKARVRSRSAEIETDIADLCVSDVPAPARLPKPERRFEEFARNADKELVIVGLRVDEALAKVKAYLNEAALSDLPEVRIVHGMGTGALRKAVEELLKSHSAVESYRPGGRGEGGQGATVVRLRE